MISYIFLTIVALLLLLFLFFFDDIFKNKMNSKISKKLEQQNRYSVAHTGVKVIYIKADSKNYLNSELKRYIKDDRFMNYNVEIDKTYTGSHESFKLRDIIKTKDIWQYIIEYDIVKGDKIWTKKYWIDMIC